MKLRREMASATILLLIALQPAIGQKIAAADAKNHIGEKAAVCGRVANEHTAVNSRGTPTFLDLDSAYPNRIFTVVVWGNDRQAVGQLPRVGSRLCVTGLIENYRAVPQMVVWTRLQLSY